jgi:3-dehydroquinate synthase
MAVVPRERTLLLCGMMGAGKTSVGRALAARLGRAFLDTDLEVERRAAMPVREIFERLGEPRFRALEREALAALPERSAVVALGGGAVASRENRELLRAKGILVLLEAQPATLAARLGDAADRPLLQGTHGAERERRLRALREQRAEAYADAELAVATDGLDVDRVCEAVLERLGWKAGAEPGEGREVRVALGERSYSIVIRPGSLSEIGPAIRRELDAERAVVVTSPRVGRAHLAPLLAGLERVGLPPRALEVPDGERAKTLRVASRLYDGLLELGADRRSVLVGLGGGATLDVAGFVASTFLRGIPLVQVPTTLLAQVDASVGGKTAVNHPRGKNLIGTFYQPRLVWIDPAVLATLPPRGRRSGMAEVIKVAAIRDAEFFAWLEQNAERALALEPGPLAHAIERACEIKAGVVSQDERETGLRALLNFGHTLGHAVENASGYGRYQHGEAVAIGMVFEGRLAEARGLAPAGTTERVERLLARVGLPTRVPDLAKERDSYLRALAVDKKGQGGKVALVVLRGIGRAELLRLTPEEILEGGA